MSISGAMLAFTDEIESAYESKWLTVQNPSGEYSYDAALSTVRSTYPGWEVRIYGSPGPNEAVVIDLRKSGEIKKIFAHPATGKVLHVENNVHRQLHRQLLTLHYTLFAGTAGKIVVFLVGILFLIAVITGTYVYRKALVKVLLFKVHLNRKSDRSFYSSLHRITGVWSLVFSILIVITGLFISGNIVLTAVSPAAAKSNSPAVTGAIRSVDEIRKDIHQQYPTFKVYLIRLAANSNIVQLSGRFADDPFYYGKYYSRFYVNGETGVLQKKEWLRDQLPFKKWQSISGPLHFGNYGGLSVKVMYAVLGLMPGLLSISGFIVWQKRRKKHRRA